MEIDYEVINRYCEKIDILEYISKHNNVKKNGRYYYCSCNNNSDSNPSLCIYPKTQSYYCFSCQKGGNIFNYLLTHEHMKFKDAVAVVSNNEIPVLETSKTKILFKTFQNKRFEEIERKKLDFKTDYLDLYPEEEIIKWQQEGISQEIMNKYYVRIDHKSNRIIYPLFDDNNNYIGWKGRSLLDDEVIKSFNIPKYLPNNKIGKIDFLVGKQQLNNNNNILIIFEGIKSVMRVAQWGYSAVSTETSHINNEQIKVLLKIKNINEIVFAYDKDKDFKYVCSQKQIPMLKRFFKISIIIDRDDLLDCKMSPCDKGRDIFEKLYYNRRII